MGLLVKVSVFEALGNHDGKKLWVGFFSELDCDDLTVRFDVAVNELAGDLIAIA